MFVPSGGSAAASCGFPRSPATAAGPMTTSHADPNFASSRLASAADESSRRRVLHFPAKPWMRFRFPSSRRDRRTGYTALSSIESASSCLAGTAFQFPAGSPSGKDCRTVQSVETSAKRGKCCEYHHSCCINRRLCGDEAEYCEKQRSGDARLLDEHLGARDVEGEGAAVGEAGDEGEEELENVGGLEVLGLGVGMGIVDEAVDGRELGTDEGDIEEGKIFPGLDGVPLDVAEGEARLDDPVGARGDGDVEGATMELGEVEAAGEEVRGLHEEGSAGKTGIAVEAGGDAMALDEAGGEELRGGGAGRVGHGSAFGGHAHPGIHSSAECGARDWGGGCRRGPGINACDVAHRATPSPLLWE